MSRTHNEAIKRAREKFGAIFPWAHKEFDDCFTEWNNSAIFWFNTNDGSTHIIMVDARE